jgi:hypothetical protein
LHRLERDRCNTLPLLHPTAGFDEGRNAMAKGKENARDPDRRKLIAFDAETWHALQLLGRDSVKSVQELAEEAFADLLKKHDRPVTLKQALRQSVRKRAANDALPRRKKR